MDEPRFWSLIEAAWQSVGGKPRTRQKLAEGQLSEAGAQGLAESLEDVIPTLAEMLDELPADELAEFDRILERKLYEIDRQEIHEYTEGSDDGFLYRRGFIVAAGKAYYDAVNANPARALSDLECEEMCYLSWHLYEEKFGHLPANGISQETCSNVTCWPGIE